MLDLDALKSALQMASQRRNPDDPVDLHPRLLSALVTEVERLRTEVRVKDEMLLDRNESIYKSSVENRWLRNALATIRDMEGADRDVVLVAENTLEGL